MCACFRLGTWTLFFGILPIMLCSWSHEDHWLYNFCICMLRIETFLVPWIWFKWPKNVCASFRFGKMWCVVTQLPINCRWFIRIGILYKQQWAQAVRAVCTRSVRQSTTTLSDDSNLMMQVELHQIHSFPSNQGSNWLNPKAAMIKLDQLVCGWRQVERLLPKSA